MTVEMIMRTLAALRPFADQARKLNGWADDQGCGTFFTVEQCRAARAARDSIVAMLMSERAPSITVGGVDGDICVRPDGDRVHLTVRSRAARHDADVEAIYVDLEVKQGPAIELACAVGKARALMMQDRRYVFGGGADLIPYCRKSGDGVFAVVEGIGAVVVVSARRVSDQRKVFTFTLPAGRALALSSALLAVAQGES